MSKNNEDAILVMSIRDYKELDAMKTEYLQLCFEAGNKNYVAIHGRIDKMTLFHHQGEEVELVDAPWDQVDESDLEASLLELFKIPKYKGPERYTSFKPYVLLFDEYYTELYQISRALDLMQQAERMIFMGTSFSVNITQMALDVARQYNTPIEVVDPSPCHVLHPDVTYHKATALEYIYAQ